MKPRIGITMGDYNGVGPEVTLKALRRPEIWKTCNPVLIGSLDVYEWYARRFAMKFVFREVEDIPKHFRRYDLPVVPIRKFHRPVIRPGKNSKESGRYSGESVAKAVELCLAHRLDAVVTAPVSKSAMRSAGYPYPGQTEMLAELSGVSHPVMMLVAGEFRVGLATIHVPLCDVSRRVSTRMLVARMSVVHQSLKKDFAKRSPSIAMLALNPHAGEDGEIGQEENKVLLPAIRSLRSKGMHVQGPFPADGFFGTHAYKDFDLVFAMYHDQGLIPLKMVGFDRGVNYTAGLPFVRTSPDHGTAFDIAGQGRANSRSMVEAIQLAATIWKNRRS